MYLQTHVSAPNSGNAAIGDMYEVQEWICVEYYYSVSGKFEPRSASETVADSLTALRYCCH